MLSCKEVSLLTSKAMDTTLSPRERLAVRLHIFYCRGCARFREQTQFLRRVARRASDPTAPDTLRLPDAARERLRAILRRER